VPAIAWRRQASHPALAAFLAKPILESAIQLLGE
jgi:hypothetical protein